MTERSVGGARVLLEQGDLTLARVEAIVNAANSSLLGGGGVDGAIHRRGGPEILAECRRIRADHHPDGLPTGRAVITTGGHLSATWVIHTVGPLYGTSPEIPRLLAACHESSLELARERGIREIAFPAISTGVYGYPLDEAAPIALGATARVLESAPGAFAEIRFVLFDARSLDAFSHALDHLA